MKKDNSTFSQKIALRNSLIKELQEPVIMETHGGLGKIWAACYSHVPKGIVFEKDSMKCEVLARQRPTWAVYEGDSIKALSAGAGVHLPVNFLDVDPYGDAWPVLDAFLFSDRPKAETLCIAVNDGLRNKIKMGGAWKVESLRKIVAKMGNGLYRIYLEACEELMKAKAAQAGYAVSRFHGYYCGHNLDMTHYAAVLTKS